ncbi:hypothetical protein V1226_18550 [Lachnospiraceae bacterium JLR.KK009]
MREKIWKGLMAICMVICLVCPPLLVDAQKLDSEILQKEERDIPAEAFKGDTAIHDISDAYENVAQIEGGSETYISNTMNRAYEGEAADVTDLPNNATLYAEQENPENTDPNNAYLVEYENIVQGTLEQEKEMRWYGFILEQTSKVSIMLETVSEVDADLYLFKLDQETYELNLIGGSSRTGLGKYEYYTDILETGIYYFAISAYEGSGQYGFALYATLDIENEINDTASNATEIDINEKITGAIDTPYDIDYYKFTLSSPVIMRITENLGNYKFSILAADNSTKVYKISEKDGMYQFNAGTYYFAVYSKDGTYSVDQDYKITANIIANIADNASSFYFTVNEKAKIVFQSDANGNNMYVNGNPIDINYDYHVDASTSAGTQKYDITMRNSSNLRAKVYQNQFMFEDAEETSYYGMVMPNTVNYISGTKGVGSAGNVLELSLYSVNSEKFYKVHCICSGAYAENNMYKDFNFTTVFINPNTGKLVDIQNINYFYDYATGSNSMLFTRPYSSSTKHYYPYFDGEEPLSW